MGEQEQWQATSGVGVSTEREGEERVRRALRQRPRRARHTGRQAHLDVANVVSVGLELANLFECVVVPHTDDHVVRARDNPLHAGNELGAANRQL